MLLVQVKDTFVTIRIQYDRSHISIILMKQAIHPNMTFCLSFSHGIIQAIFQNQATFPFIIIGVKSLQTIIGNYRIEEVFLSPFHEISHQYLLGAYPSILDSSQGNRSLFAHLEFNLISQARDSGKLSVNYIIEFGIQVLDIIEVICRFTTFSPIQQATQVVDYSIDDFEQGRLTATIHPHDSLHIDATAIES